MNKIIEEQIIEFDASPTGKAYIGLAKKPLMPNENGIGFKGVKLQTSDRKKIMCNECGGWYKTITESHTQFKHDLSLDDYKDKFGFSPGTTLCSDEMDKIYLRNAKNLDGHRLDYEERIKLLNDARKIQAELGISKKVQNSMEKKNALGTCPEQLKTALKNYIHRYKRIPTRHDSIDKDGFPHSWILVKRFGNINDALKHYGLPTRHKSGQKTIFVFPDGCKFIKYPGDGYNNLYKLMCLRCNLLK